MRALGVATPTLSKGDLGTSISEKDGYSFKEKGKGKGVHVEVARVKTEETKDSLWVHVGDRDLSRREEQLSRCLVGCFGESFESVPPLVAMKEWAFETWSLKGDLNISRLGVALVLFEFQNKCEADSVLLKGSRRIKDREFLL